MAKTAPNIVFGELKAAIVALNDGCKIEPPMRTVGVAKTVMIETFEANLVKMHEAEAEIPEICIQFYNDNLSDEAKDPAPDPNAKKSGGQGRPKGLKIGSSLGKSLDELKKTVADPKTTTQKVNAMLVEGNKLVDIVAGANAFTKEKGLQVKEWNLAQLKGHIGYCKKKWGWVFNEQGEKEAATAIITAVNPPTSDKK